MKGTLEAFALRCQLSFRKGYFSLFLFLYRSRPQCCLFLFFIAAYLVLLHQGLRVLFEVSESHLYNAVFLTPLVIN